MLKVSIIGASNDLKINALNVSKTKNSQFQNDHIFLKLKYFKANKTKSSGSSY